MRKQVQKVFASIFISIIVVGLVGCGNSSKDAGSQKMKETLNVAIESDITTLDPQDHNEVVTSYATHSIYDTLFRADTTGNVHPHLAESYEYNSDTELVISIYEGIKFHDGSELKSQDVKASLDRARESKTVQFLYETIESVDVVDDYTVQINLSVAYAPLIGNLSHSGAGIMPKSFIENPDFTAPIGSGAWKFVSWDTDEKVVFVRNDEYYFTDQISEFTNLVLKVVPEASTRTIQLESKEVDLVPTLETISYKRVEEDPDLTPYKLPTNNINYVFFNLEAEPFQGNLDLRKAFAHAIDKESINIIVNDEMATVIDGLTPDNIIGYSDDVTYEYDVEKAKEYLTKSGYVQGSQPLTIYVSGDQRIKVAEVIQSDLGKIGLEVKVQQADFTQWLEKVRAGEYQFGVIGWTTATEPDRFFSPLLHTNSIGGWNFSRYSNARVDEIIDTGKGILDNDERAATYKELYDTVMSDAPWVPLFSTNKIVGASSSIDLNDSITAEGSIYFNYIQLK